MSHPLRRVECMLLNPVVDEACAHIEALDFETCSGADAVAAMEQLVRLRDVAGGAISRCGLRIEETSAHEATGHRDAASLVASRSRISRVEARRDLDTARRLGDLPQTATALRSGEISSSQAGLIAGAATNRAH